MDFEGDFDKVNKELYRMGTDIGARLLDEFLIKSRAPPCQDFRDACEVMFMDMLSPGIEPAPYPSGYEQSCIEDVSWGNRRLCRLGQQYRGKEVPFGDITASLR